MSGEPASASDIHQTFEVFRHGLAGFAVERHQRNPSTMCVRDIMLRIECMELGGFGNLKLGDGKITMPCGGAQQGLLGS